MFHSFDQYISNLCTTLIYKINQNAATKLLASRIQSFENWMQVEIVNWMLEQDPSLEIIVEKHHGIDIWTRKYSIECKIIQTDWKRLGYDVDKLFKLTSGISEEFLVLFLFFSRTKISEKNIRERTQVYSNTSTLVLLKLFEVENLPANGHNTYGCFGALRIRKN